MRLNQRWCCWAIAAIKAIRDATILAVKQKHEEELSLLQRPWRGPCSHGAFWGDTFMVAAGGSQNDLCQHGEARIGSIGLETLLGCGTAAQDARPTYTRETSL